MTVSEGQLLSSDHLSAVKDGTVAQVSLSEAPERKPLPATAAATAAANASVGGGSPGGLTSLYSKLFSRYRGLDKRKRRLVIALAIVAVAALLGLIIGLSVGLTVGKKDGAKNLPLPTGDGGPYTGDLTYYEPALGSCGISSSSTDNICAVSHVLYDAASSGSDPNQNPLCGLKLRLKGGDTSVDVKVVDRCVGCKPTDIDVSMSVFEQLAPVKAGRVTVQWAWIDKAPDNILHE